MTEPSVSKRRFTVGEISGADPYKLTTGLIVPRPIGWIGNVAVDGTPNLAPCPITKPLCVNARVLWCVWARRREPLAWPRLGS